MLKAGPQRFDLDWVSISAKRIGASESIHFVFGGRCNWALGIWLVGPGITMSAARGLLRGCFVSPALPLSWAGSSMAEKGVTCEARRPEKVGALSGNSVGNEREERRACQAREGAASGGIRGLEEKSQPIHADKEFNRWALGARRINSGAWEPSRVLPDPVTIDAMDSKKHSGYAHGNGQARRVLGWLTAILLLSCGGGCGPADDRVAVYPVSGQVRLNGQPLANALVVFHPQNPADTRTPVAQGRSDDSGKFQLTSYETHDGAAAGEFAVTVQAFQLIKQGDSYTPGPNILPAKLAKPDSTDIRVTISPQPNELAPIDLKK